MEYGYGKDFAVLSTGTGHFQETEVRNKYVYGQFLKIIIRIQYEYRIVFGDLVRVRVRVIVKFDFQLRVRNPGTESLPVPAVRGMGYPYFNFNSGPFTFVTKLCIKILVV